MFNSFRFP